MKHGVLNAGVALLCSLVALWSIHRGDDLFVFLNSVMASLNFGVAYYYILPKETK
jgi:hypothetical protein